MKAEIQSLPPSVKQIHKRPTRNSLLPEQADRWDALVKRAPAGLSEENLVLSDAILRSQRFVLAHQHPEPAAMGKYIH